MTSIGGVRNTTCIKSEYSTKTDGKGLPSVNDDKFNEHMKDAGIVDLENPAHIFSDMLNVEVNDIIRNLSLSGKENESLKEIGNNYAYHVTLTPSEFIDLLCADILQRHANQRKVTLELILLINTAILKNFIEKSKAIQLTYTAAVRMASNSLVQAFNSLCRGISALPEKNKFNASKKTLAHRLPDVSSDKNNDDRLKSGKLSGTSASRKKKLQGASSFAVYSQHNEKDSVVYNKGCKTQRNVLNTDDKRSLVIAVLPGKNSKTAAVEKMSGNQKENFQLGGETSLKMIQMKRNQDSLRQNQSEESQNNKPLSGIYQDYFSQIPSATEFLLKHSETIALLQQLLSKELAGDADQKNKFANIQKRGMEDRERDELNQDREAENIAQHLVSYILAKVVMKLHEAK